MSYEVGLILWAQNRETIKKEIAEIRKLVVEVEHAVCFSEISAELCDEAKRARQIIHDTPDPFNVQRGLKELEELLDAMKGLDIPEEKHLREATDSLASRSVSVHLAKLLSSDERDVSPKEKMNLVVSLMQRPATAVPLVFEDIDTPELRTQAYDILTKLDAEWEIGPHFMPVQSTIDTPFPEETFRYAGGSSYNYAENMVRKLVGLDANSFFGPSSKDLQKFNLMRTACELALEDKNVWAASLIRCTAVAAHELRRGASTGLHGPERLQAKLVVGKLTGQLATYNLLQAVELADLNIESATFSWGQVLEAVKSDTDSLEYLCDAWEKATHPMHSDILARAFLWRGQTQRANVILEQARKELFNRKYKRSSFAPGRAPKVWYEDRYRGIVRDIYLGRLARTLSIVDSAAALEWCSDITELQVALQNQLEILGTSKDMAGDQLHGRLQDTLDRAEAHNLLDKPASPVMYALQEMPSQFGYPEFPAERWVDVIGFSTLTIADKIVLIRESNELSEQRAL
jgi:hypothetical protein